MLSPSARQKIANEAINFILQAFYAGVVYSVLAAGRTIYAWITGADQQWVFLGLGALGTLFLVLVTTGVVVWQRSKSKPLQTVGRKGYLDFRKDAEAAIHQLQVDIPKITAINQRMGEIASNASKRPDTSSHRAIHAGVVKVSKKINRQASIMRIRSGPVKRNVDLLIESITGWSDWVRKRQGPDEIQSLLPLIRSIGAPLQQTISSLESFQASLQVNIREMSQEMDLAGGAFHSEMDAVLKRIKQLRACCHQQISLLDPYTSGSPS